MTSARMKAYKRYQRQQAQSRTTPTRAQQGERQMRRTNAYNQDFTIGNFRKRLETLLPKVWDTYDPVLDLALEQAGHVVVTNDLMGQHTCISRAGMALLRAHPAR